MTEVVAGLDMSAVGRRVLERSRLMAEHLGDDLRVTHVVESVDDAMMSPELAKLLEDSRRERLEKMGAWVRERTELGVRIDLIRGSPSWELVRASKGNPLLVMGSSSVDSSRLGPVTAQAARMAPSDVLVVRRQPRGLYRKIIIGVDFSDASAAAVRKTVSWYPDAELTAVFALPSRFDSMLHEAGLYEVEIEAARTERQKRAEDRMGEFIQPWEDRVRTVVTDGPPREALGEAGRRHRADLVVVASRGAGATKMVLLGSVAEGVLWGVPTDVHIVRVPSQFRRP
ncbi:MAG: hypothetical protein GEU79_18910 [Acidimicrobiia bacterium]|nr:hypothetical protein [Acidimicrobiia bacterium]